MEMSILEYQGRASAFSFPDRKEVLFPLFMMEKSGWGDLSCLYTGERLPIMIRETDSPLKALCGSVQADFQLIKMKTAKWKREMVALPLPIPISFQLYPRRKLRLSMR